MLESTTDTAQWDHVGATGSWIIWNPLIYIPCLSSKKIDNKYWMIYHAYPQVGYEAGGAVMGLAWCEDNC